MNAGNPRRARAIALGHDSIVGAAIILIEEEGLDALSARRLAARLGCEAMSLYNYFSGMEDVRDAVVGALVADARRRTDPALPPAERIHANAQAYLDIAARFPNAFALVATRLWTAPPAVAAAAANVEAFTDHGLAPADAWRNARILGAYLNGAGLALAAWRRDAGQIALGRAHDQVPAPLRGGSTVRDDLYAGLELLIARLLG